MAPEPRFERPLQWNGASRIFLDRLQMNDLWKNLEEQSRTWDALNRQGLANAIWADYVTVRFRRTGDPRALEYLYPYLSNARTRNRAIKVACDVFEGRGTRALDALTYFTRNPDLYLKDRAINVVAAAVTGSSADVIIDTLSPYLDSKNLFIRNQAVRAVGRAAKGCADQRIVEKLQAVGQVAPSPSDEEIAGAIGSVFSGSPTEDIYSLVLKMAWPDRERLPDLAVISQLAQGADEAWFDRICNDLLDRALVPEQTHEDRNRFSHKFRHRSAVRSLSLSGKGRGMTPFEMMLRVRRTRAATHHMLSVARRCFDGVSEDACVPSLSDLAKTGDVPTQRVASICLGHVMKGKDDERTVGLLSDLCRADNGSVRAAALRGLAMAARSSCDETLRSLCLSLARESETAREAILTLGAVFLGSGRGDGFEDVRNFVVSIRSRPVPGKKHSKPLAACYLAAGFVYLGTGSLEPVDFLLDGIPQPMVAYPQWQRNGWGLGAAARGLVMTEFPESVLGTLVER